MTKIKVCGITNLLDAQAAVAAGADALGFNFYPQSLRYLSPIEARAIIEELPLNIIFVGIFANVADPREVLDAAMRAKVHSIQLHGDESPDYCRQLAPHPVIKALRVGAEFKIEALRDFPTEAILLDAFSPQALGGSGESFDWSIARQARQLVKKLYLAGGLNPDNVSAAIDLVRPYAVDVCSGVEAAPRVKDHALLRRFVEQVRRRVRTLTPSPAHRLF